MTLIGALALGIGVALVVAPLTLALVIWATTKKPPSRTL